jgi:hypothetical protein
MTTAMITDVERLRTRLVNAIARQMPEHIERLGWDAGRLAAHQRDRLRALLARAIADSPFHAGRLRGVDPDRFELADLARLPVVTKAQMMENFDTATTDRRLTRDLVEQHVARCVTDPSLLRRRPSRRSAWWPPRPACRPPRSSGGSTPRSRRPCSPTRPSSPSWPGSSARAGCG